MIKKFKYISLVIYFLLISTNPIFANDQYQIEAEKVSYQNDKNLIIAEGKAIAKNNLGRKIFADRILYYKNKQLIETFGNSKYEDDINIISANNFIHSIKNKTIEAIGNVKFTDKDKNKYTFKNFKYFQDKKFGKGNDISAKFTDSSYLESASGIIDNAKEITVLKNAKFTTCSNIKNHKNEFCPSWSLKSKKVTHNKKERKIIHNNAFLRIKNIPILYTPYFSHPDPSVKRQSGFLPPLIKTISNIGRTINIPYFWVISDDKDLTLTPVYYFDERHMLKSSYRQDLKNGFLQVENAYQDGYKNLNKSGRTSGSRNYFFSKYKGNKDDYIFKNNEIELNFQRISQSNFVRVNKINTDLFREDIRTLENSVRISSYEGSKRLELKAGIFENLDTNDTSKYTYFFPDGSFSYNTKNIKNFNTNFNTYFLGQKFSKNQKQAKIKNIITFDSNQYINKKYGIGSTFKASVINNNIYNDNITNAEDNLNFDNYTTFAVDNTFPMAKFSKGSYQTLTPRIFLKNTFGTMKDARSTDKILNYSDIFSMNRTNDLDKPETGFSVGHGFDYIYSASNKSNPENQFKASFGLGQVLRKNQLENMPRSSSLNNKTSDIAGYSKLDFFGDKKMETDEKINFLSYFNQNKISINYDFNLENNLSKLNRNKINLDGSYNNLYTSIAFDEKNNHTGNARSGEIEFKGMLADNYFISLNAKKNFKTNSSEFHNLSLNFENDCLLASLALSKDFYYDKDLKNNKTLIFSIILKPFSDNFAPDLSDFIN